MNFELNKLYNMDCLTAMKTIPDNFFELAIVDPPYGNANFECEKPFIGGRGRNALNKKKIEKKIIDWDIAPKKEYFNELFRVSKNQIIWGGNYFDLPPTRCFAVWRKLTIGEKFTMAMCEYAWTSFNANAKIFECVPQGTANEERLHPTQKPIKLYSWILNLFAKKGDRILDTHVGSASSLIACHKAGFQYLGFEIDKTYFQKATARLNRYKNQQSFFDIGGNYGAN
ncbi:MAG: site-specific DNA-methyltransferase [Firmicutes bacterium]|nr:site-specific DNA-methyltransferase [Bacillota bacterium]